MLGLIVEPMEHMPGRAVVGRADGGDMDALDVQTYSMPGRPPDPVRPSEFDNYETDTGVYGQGIATSRKSLAFFINPFQKNGTKNYYNENANIPGGKPAVIYDNRGRVLDDRSQYPGQQRFRYDVNIPRPAYMSFSDLVDQEGVYTQ